GVREYLFASDSPLCVRRFVLGDLGSRSCRWNQSCVAGGSSGLLPQHLPLLCGKCSTHRTGFLVWSAVGVPEMDVASGPVGQTSPRAVFEFHSPTGDARASSEKAA